MYISGKLLIVTTICLMTSSTACAEDKRELSDAFRNGLIAMTFSGSESGKKVILTIKNNTDKQLLLTLNNGETQIKAGDFVFSFSSDRVIDINLSEKNESSLTLPQTGKQRIVGGSATFTPIKGGLRSSYDHFEVGAGK